MLCTEDKVRAQGLELAVEIRSAGADLLVRVLAAVQGWTSMRSTSKESACTCTHPSPSCSLSVSCPRGASRPAPLASITPHHAMCHDQGEKIGGIGCWCPMHRGVDGALMECCCEGLRTRVQRLRGSWLQRLELSVLSDGSRVERLRCGALRVEGRGSRV